MARRGARAPLPIAHSRLWRSAARSEDRARQGIDSVGRRLTYAPPQDLPRERTGALGDEFAGEHALVGPPLVTPLPRAGGSCDRELPRPRPGHVRHRHVRPPRDRGGPRDLTGHGSRLGLIAKVEDAAGHPLIAL